MRHIILISGKDSLATALVQTARAPELDYTFVHNATGWDLPETMEWLGRVGEYFGRPVLHLGDDLTSICYRENCLPIPQRRFCTKYAKIWPLNDYLGHEPSTVYFGLRADEPERKGYRVPAKQALVPAYPLRELGFGLTDVWNICQRANLCRQRFIGHGWRRGSVSCSCETSSCSTNESPGSEPRCSLGDLGLTVTDASTLACTRRWGLYEHHPDRFEDACRLEETLCHRDEYSWSQGYKLRDLIARAPQIKEARAKAIARHLRDLQQPSFLGDFDDDELDDLEVTSCGLFCGK